MNGIKLILITLVAVWLEVSFFGALRPFGIIPNVFLVIILEAAAILPRSSDALAMAVGGGFLLDLSSGVDFGLRTGFFTFLTLLVTLMRRTGADFSRISMRLTAVMSGTILYNLAVLSTLALSHSTIPVGLVAEKIIIEIVENIILAVVLHYPIRKLIENQHPNIPVIPRVE
ncbi:MAG: hypothetical protein ACHQUB_02340 [Candidatus Saccharimonadia bacterium]